GAGVAGAWTHEPCSLRLALAAAMNAAASAAVGVRRATRAAGPVGIIPILAFARHSSSMAQWLQGRVAARRDWTDSLHSLEVEAPELTFVAGQFARLALPSPPGEKDPMLGRPYSFVNPPHRQPHEFYFIVFPGGPLTPRLAALNIGDPVWLSPRATGFFSSSEVAQADVLWCLSTGTGIGPFLS